MSRRGRALAFVLAALLAAAAAAAIADGYGDQRRPRLRGAARRWSSPARDLEAGAAIDPRQAASALELRRVPARFVPPGRAARARPRRSAWCPPRRFPPAPTCSPRSCVRRAADAAAALGLGRGRHPVEIAVSGAEALLVAGAQPVGERVDVVVTTEPSGSGSGRTYVAAAAVPLLALGPGGEGAAAEGVAAATLGLTRGQALRLIAAESFARRVTLLARG